MLSGSDRQYPKLAPQIFCPNPQYHGQDEKNNMPLLGHVLNAILNGKRDSSVTFELIKRETIW